MIYDALVQFWILKSEAFVLRGLLFCDIFNTTLKSEYRFTFFRGKIVNLDNDLKKCRTEINYRTRNS